MRYIHRFEEKMMIPLGIIPGGNKKTNLMSFLRPFVDEINSLSSNGLRVVKNGELVFSGKVFVVGITGDILGIASLMNH